MKKPAYIPFICISCDLRFAIHKKDYDKNHAYNCPMCLKANVITAEDLKPEKVGRPQKTFNRMILNDDKPQLKKEEPHSTDNSLETGMKVWLGHCDKEGVIMGKGKVHKTRDKYKIKIGADLIFFDENETRQFRDDWMKRENDADKN